jgi:phage terminase Nu1 subunit (DNA packaging protein)
MTKAKAIVRTLEATAAYFEVSPQSVRRWIKAGCPIVSRGRSGRPYELDLRAVQRWRRDRDGATAAEAEARAEQEARLRLEALGADMMPDLTVDGQPMTPRQLEAALKAEISKVRLAQLRGELVSFEETAMKVASAMAELSARLLAIPDHWGAEQGLSDAQIEIMRAAFEDTLNDAADAIRDLEPNDDGVAA